MSCICDADWGGGEQGVWEAGGGRAAAETKAKLTSLSWEEAAGRRSPSFGI